jgi:putative intracellular protease/amidase
LAADSEAAPRGRVLFVLTSHDRLGDSGRSTGYYLSEVSHPHRVFLNRGYAVDFASVKGGAAPMDPASLDREDVVNESFLSSPDCVALTTTRRVADVDPDPYDALFFPGGHGTMWDLPGNLDVAGLASQAYAAGRVVGAVCHGPVALVDAVLPDGRPLLRGRTVTCFSNEEERAVSLDPVVPFLLEDRLRERGATVLTAAPFEPQVVAWERLVTGQNPASARGTALAMVKLLES